LNDFKGKAYESGTMNQESFHENKDFRSSRLLSETASQKVPGWKRDRARRVSFQKAGKSSASFADLGIKSEQNRRLAVWHGWMLLAFFLLR
jgi:hypothetical protein